MKTNYSFLSNADPAYIEGLYKKFLVDPKSVDEGWQMFFAGFDYSEKTGSSSENNTDLKNPGIAQDQLNKEFAVLSIIHGFRDRGHLLSITNPVRERKDRKPTLELSNYGLEESDRKAVFEAGKEIGLENGTLADILAKLRKIYCGHIGFEYQHIENKEKRQWLKERIEHVNPDDSYGLDLDEKKRILEKLNGAEVFERFLHTKYVGQKRFSLEGGEGTIAALDAVIQNTGKYGVNEIIIGMAHRGRLNVLANVMGKTYAHIFNEFEGNTKSETIHGDGDVKYHLGYSSIIETESGHQVHLKLSPNPSHLEAVNTVVQGYARAKGDLIYKNEYDKVFPILIHGDAAIAGQGVVYETVQMSELEGYDVGGTLHYVINNQIGFTTNFEDARSSTYCTGVAKMVQAPVFHVNGDDPEALIFATKLAMEYRQKFNNDVFIDMVCYRKHGHNEGDDPKFTQPHLYDLISKHPSPREVYRDKLIQSGDLEKQIAESMEKKFWSFLQDRLDEIKQKSLPYQYQEPEQQWRKLKFTADEADFEQSPKTGISKKQIKELLDHLNSAPENMEIISKMKRVFKGQNKLIEEDLLNWGLAELVAYGSILTEGKNVRISGQDVKRGTFSHRHAILYDKDSYKPFNRLDGLSEDQGKFMIYNSLLSEFGVLGFEFGYSMASPQSLVLWEAQFGDFYNGAQVMVDQFIMASESKWNRMSGLVMLLPHGYEGQGPEHSSARLERFLQSSAECNVCVVNMTTPANLFHALRRQLKREFRKPLIVMSPKSLLRHPLCVSNIKDIQTGTSFKEVITDDVMTTKSVKKVILCSGKIYYELFKYRESKGINNVAIVRIEQLFPFPEKQVSQELKKYAKAKVCWVQEEPKNMGASNFIFEAFNGDIERITRKASSSTATGYKKTHDEQQLALITEAFKI